MIVRIANALSVTVDQLLREYYSEPEKVYLREIAERIEKYPVKQRVYACEGLAEFLNTIEKFSQTDEWYAYNQTEKSLRFIERLCYTKVQYGRFLLSENKEVVPLD